MLFCRRGAAVCHDVTASRADGGSMSYSDREKVQQDYLDMLGRYKSRGIKVRIDGEDLPEQEWNRIFQVAERSSDGAKGFYMADYIQTPDGALSEIRLDRIYVNTFDIPFELDGRR